MKTIFTLSLLLCICAHSFAISSYQIFQTNFRWRNNDGGEATATWKAAQNANVSGYDGKSVIRLRIEIVNTSRSSQCSFGNSCPATISLSDSLQYSTTPADNSSWRNIGLEAAKPFVITGAGGLITQDEATTQQLTDTGHYGFSAGKIMVTDSVLKSSIGGNSRSEYEWSLAGAAGIKPGTTYYFRQKFRTTYASGNLAAYTYSTYPALTTASVLPVTLSGFTVSREDKKVRIEWQSASEQNTAYFNIQRSTDAQSWQTVSKVNAQGTASPAHHYLAYDNNPPLYGTAYYRLAEVDKGGNISFSSIASLSVAGGSLSVSVYPNPAHDVATLQFAGTAGTKYSITVIDLQGKPVWHKEAVAVQGNNQETVPVISLAKGIYLIKLINGGSVQNLRMVKGE